MAKKKKVIVKKKKKKTTDKKSTTEKKAVESKKDKQKSEEASEDTSVEQEESKEEAKEPKSEKKSKSSKKSKAEKAAKKEEDAAKAKAEKNQALLSEAQSLLSAGNNGEARVKLHALLEAAPSPELTEQAHNILDKISMDVRTLMVGAIGMLTLLLIMTIKFSHALWTLPVLFLILLIDPKLFQAPESAD